MENFEKFLEERDVEKYYLQEDITKNNPQSNLLSGEYPQPGQDLFYQKKGEASPLFTEEDGGTENKKDAEGCNQESKDTPLLEDVLNCSKDNPEVKLELKTSKKADMNKPEDLSKEENYSNMVDSLLSPSLLNSKNLPYRRDVVNKKILRAFKKFI